MTIIPIPTYLYLHPSVPSTPQLVGLQYKHRGKGLCSLFFPFILELRFYCCCNHTGIGPWPLANHGRPYTLRGCSAIPSLGVNNLTLCFYFLMSKGLLYLHELDYMGWSNFDRLPRFFTINYPGIETFARQFFEN